MLLALVVTTLLAATAVEDEQATRIADEMMEAQGGQENWDKARYIRFTNVRRERRATFTWDRHLGRLRIEAKNDGGVPFVILMNIQSQQGSAYVEGRQLQGKEHSEYLARGSRMWPGATYWFLMPFKWKDPGVTLAYDGEEELGGVVYDKVHLTFDGVGRSPGDQYWAYVNRKTHLMDRWKFKLEAGAEGEYQWTGWQRHGGLRVATERVGAEETIRFEDVFIGDSVPEELFTSPEAIKFP